MYDRNIMALIPARCGWFITIPQFPVELLLVHSTKRNVQIMTPWIELSLLDLILCELCLLSNYFLLGSLRYSDYGLRTTAGRALSFVCSTGLSRANIER